MELLLTFEEYCAEEGDFVGDNGTVFAEMFPQVGHAGLAGWDPPSAGDCKEHSHALSDLLRMQVVKLCYDHDLLSEEAILDWANEKEHAATEDRRFVNLCGDLLAWLEDADEESSEDSDA